MSLKRQQKWAVVWLILGAVLWVAAFGLRDMEWLSGMGAAFLAIGGARLLRVRRMSKDPERAADYEAAMRDERTAYIANKARAWVFFLSIYVELAIGLVAVYLLDDRQLSMVMLGLVCAQSLGYSALFWHFGKKY